MGVSWHPCSRCGETYPDCGYYVRCSDLYCGRSWCGDLCAERDGYVSLSEEDPNWDDDNHSNCKYCRKEEVEDDVLFQYLLKTVGMNREEVLEKWKRENT